MNQAGFVVNPEFPLRGIPSIRPSLKLFEGKMPPLQPSGKECFVDSSHWHWLRHEKTPAVVARERISSVWVRPHACSSAIIYLICFKSFTYLT